MSVVHHTEIEGVPFGLFRGANDPVIENANDMDDPEYQQSRYEVEVAGDDFGLDNIFGSAFSQCARSDMYRAWVYPELYPNERQPVLSNWSVEDLEAYCGIYPDSVLHAPRYYGDLYPYEEGPFADPSN